MNYVKILPFDLANGTGVRISLFVSGCRFHCLGCFNQESQDFDFGKPFTQNTVKTILNLVSNPYVSGLSILGGDPIWQDGQGLKNLRVLMQEIHRLNKTTWIWSGFTWEEIMDINKDDYISILRKDVIALSDVFIDGRFEKDLKDLTLKWRGSSNQRVIDVQKSLSANKVILYEDTN